MRKAADAKRSPSRNKWAFWAAAGPENILAGGLAEGRELESDIVHMESGFGWRPAPAPGVVRNIPLSPTLVRPARCSARLLGGPSVFLIAFMSAGTDRAATADWGLAEIWTAKPQKSARGRASDRAKRVCYQVWRLYQSSMSRRTRSFSRP